ncbi:MAG: PspC domain-containing protein [Dehalococcoidia bacterium]|nr:PspC domain-containing protein [Dehalococcoidia bacterium]
MQKRLYRSRTNRVIWGVCGGIAEYFNIDPVIVRIIAVLLILANGIGIIAYIVMAIIVPLEGSRAATPHDTIKENVEEMKVSAEELGREIKSTFEESKTRHAAETRNRNLYILGIIIVILGVIFLMGTLNFFWWFRWGFLWPIILVAIGVLLLITARRK